MTVHFYVHSIAKRAEAVALVDSGATENFMNLSYVRWLKLPIQTLQQPRKIFNVDGTTNKSGELKYFTDLEVQTGPNLSWAKPTPSHTQANACTSPAVPALKPSYSQVTRLGMRARDPGKQHMIGAQDRPRDLQVLWGSRDPRACDPGKKIGDLSRDWSAIRSGDYRYMTHPLNHPVGTTNGGVRINKVV